MGNFSKLYHEHLFTRRKIYKTIREQFTINSITLSAAAIQSTLHVNSCSKEKHTRSTTSPLLLQKLQIVLICAWRISLHDVVGKEDVGDMVLLHVSAHILRKVA